MNELYRIIPFVLRHGNCGGSLVQFQRGGRDKNALPFGIGKVLVMSDIRTDDVRGMHAHHETEEILVALSGGCTVEMDDGRGQNAAVRVSACGGEEVSALLLYPHVWRTMRDFAPGTMLLVVANIPYDEGDYIRDRAEFERLAGQEWAAVED